MSQTDRQWPLQDGGYAAISPKSIRVQIAGVTVAESKQVLVVAEARKLPVYYFPRSDVRTDILIASTDREQHGDKGEATFFSLQIDGRTVERAAWAYADPQGEGSFLKGYISFVWKQIEVWHEDEERIAAHPHNPYLRFKAVPSTSHIQVYIGGELVANSRRPVIVSEAGLPDRYYLPKEDVRMDLLEPSDSASRCQYKGSAAYWSAQIGGKTYSDVVWSYPEALPEVHEISGLLCFYNEIVDALYIDGEQWSPVAKDNSVNA
ncbi:DUF427 domain-containing protein [Paenibacillus sp. GCM10012307]|uniref:DUF427 domain-containing protein n=1 Tax=Paenibacillus roseus TaxID=2798579 RepID=A0A934J309_9BACL|nr:DUF427 domain-containing protein [Paenibacillus roseus]MBJ6359916.1 DUF427 domain-containing protein [Paenibacillus roseus]